MTRTNKQMRFSEQTMRNLEYIKLFIPISDTAIVETAVAKFALELQQQYETEQEKEE